MYFHCDFKHNKIINEIMFKYAIYHYILPLARKLIS